MNSFGKCKYCGSELVTELYKNGRCRPLRMIIYCSNEKCKIQPCTLDGVPSVVMEDAKELIKKMLNHEEVPSRELAKAMFVAQSILGDECSLTDLEKWASQK